MKLLVWYWGRKGGGPKYTLEMVKGLLANNVDVFLSLSKQAENYEEFLALERPGFYIDTYSGLPEFIKASLFLPKIRSQFIAYLKKNDIHTVYSTMHHIWTPYVAREFKKNSIWFISHA